MVRPEHKNKKISGYKNSLQTYFLSKDYLYSGYKNSLQEFTENVIKDYNLLLLYMEKLKVIIDPHINQAGSKIEQNQVIFFLLHEPICLITINYNEHYVLKCKISRGIYL